MTGLDKRIKKIRIKRSRGHRERERRRRCFAGINKFDHSGLQTRNAVLRACCEKV